MSLKQYFYHDASRFGLTECILPSTILLSEIFITANSNIIIISK